VGDVSSVYGAGAYGSDTYGYSLTVIRPTGLFEYVGTSTGKVLVVLKPAPGASERRGTSVVRAQVPVRPMAAVGDRAGYVAMTVTGNQTQPVLFYGVGAAVGTVRIVLQTALRPVPFASDRRGTVVMRSQAVLRPRAVSEFRAWSVHRATFKFPVRPVRFELAGTVRMSYAWSDLTAVGRYPGGDLWQPISDAADLWQTVPDPARN
jgi:hypothetical protein